jgi:predicted nucleic acid-binding protein
VILVDTSVWIDFFNGVDSTEAFYLHECIGGADPLILPGLVLTEILQGLRSDDDVERVARVLSAFDLAPELEITDYRAAAGIYRACRAKGFTIRSTIDCLLAQLCLRHDYELLAKDRDFDLIGRVFPIHRVGSTSSTPVVHDRPRSTAR